MELIFGLGCDGSAYPFFPGHTPGAVNAAVVGPRGLLQTLEIQLGLTRPVVVEAVRIAAYATKLKAAVLENGALFCVKSFQSDPWATAKAVLSWRDALISLGWSGNVVGSKRIDDLAAVERSGEPVPFGMFDRLAAVLRALKSGDQITLRTLRVVEPRHLLPPHFDRLVRQLEVSGVRIDGVADEIDQTGIDLNRLQAFLKTGEVTSLLNDGTATIVEASTSLMAAEAVAEWIVAGSDAALADTVVINPDGDTALLDRVFQAHGLPALGQSAASPWRGALQVLPMAFAASWAPFNPRALLDLLMLPRPPIGRSAARKLSYALSKEPGIGGFAWKDAWAKIEADLRERFQDHPEQEKEVRARLDGWNSWTQPTSSTRRAGMPAVIARQIAARVTDWAVKLDGGKRDPLLLSVAAAGSAMCQAIEVLSQDVLPALLIDRLIEQVLADGASNPKHIATAGGLVGVERPEALWAPAQTVIWWNFRGPGERIPVQPWTNAELQVLAKVGLQPEPRARVAQRISWNQANAVLRAASRIIFVRCALHGAEETISHPLSHHLQPILASPSADICWRAEQLLAHGEHYYSGRMMRRHELDVTELPKVEAHWALPKNAIAKLENRRESATSFERLIDCQLRWLISDVLRLKPGRFAQIPGTDQLLGNLAHEIANEVFKPGLVLDADFVHGKAAQLFDEKVAAIAAPLLQPEYAGELAHARVTVPNSLAHLSRLLTRMGGF